MSDTELHFGKLKRPYPAPLKEGETFDDFYKKKCAEKGITELPSYFNNWRECFLDAYDEKYVVVDDNVFEIVEHTEGDAGDSFVKMWESREPNGETTYSFVTSFYNGGTYLAEMLEEGLEEILKKQIKTRRSQ